MKIHTSYPILGKLLFDRYQVVQVLSAGAFGQTYIAEDISQPEHPQCVIKHLKLVSKEPNSLRTVRRWFTNEATALEKLGNHPQIPKLLGRFEDNQEFYLVQQFIAGRLLTEELPLSKCYGKYWTQTQVVQLLQEVLSILDFVHSQGTIHCDIKPNNLIRRASDGKLFLIDFGAAQPIRSITAQLPLRGSLDIKVLGYLPVEQLSGQARPNSDIYALGMIAIQALTGLEPPQFPIDLDTGEIIWQNQVPVSDELILVLNQMVRYSYQERYQSATEVLQALQQYNLFNQPSLMATDGGKANRASVASGVNSASVLRRVGFGLAAANTLAITFGCYTLLNASASSTGADVLAKAMEKYHGGDLDEAIALANSISSNSNLYSEAQSAIREWRQNWKTATEQFQMVEQAYKDNRWLDVLKEANKIPDTSFWQEKIKLMVQHAEAQVEGQIHPLLQKAYNRAANKDFTGALRLLKMIRSQAPNYTKIQAKIDEYQEKQSIKATYLLQKAYDSADIKDFDTALNYLRQIPEETLVYPKAQAKILQYTDEKQRINLEVEKAVKARNTAANGNTSTGKKSNPIASTTTKLTVDVLPARHRPGLRINWVTGFPIYPSIQVVPIPVSTTWWFPDSTLGADVPCLSTSFLGVNSEVSPRTSNLIPNSSSPLRSITFAASISASL